MGVRSPGRAPGPINRGRANRERFGYSLCKVKKWHHLDVLAQPHFDAQFPPFSTIHPYIQNPWHNGTMGRLRRINHQKPMAQWMAQSWHNGTMDGTMNPKQRQ
jgi:hypothetical protein